MIELPKFRQGDDKWARRYLSPSNATMDRYGCFITSVCMALWNHHPLLQWEPDELLDRLISVNGLTPEGELIWSSVGAVTNGIVHQHQRIYTGNSAANMMKMEINTAVDRVRRLIDMGQPTLLSVDAVGNDRREDHAILSYDYETDGRAVSDFHIIDPAYGDDVLFSSRYGEIRDGLFGYVTIIGPGLYFPDQSEEQKDAKALWKALQVYHGNHVQTYSKEIIDILL